MSAWAAPRPPGGFEEDAHAAVGERHDSVVCEGRAEQIAADPFELLTVATVDGRRGVEMHPERCHRQRRPGRGLLRRDQMRAREPELHAAKGGDGEVAMMDKIVWEAGPAARAPDWDALPEDRQSGAMRAFDAFLARQ